MYVRNKKTALTGAKTNVSTDDTSIVKYIATLIPRYATTEVIRSTRARTGRGAAYSANDARENPAVRGGRSLRSVDVAHAVAVAA